MAGSAAKIVISERQQKLLEEFRKSRTIGKSIAQRAAIVLLGFAGMLNEEIALRVGLNRQQVGLWRQRWRDAWDALCVWECTEPHRLREGILDVLADAPRPGAPATFTAEQVSRIVALACEPPKLSGRPLDHWTLRELRDEAIKRNIVTEISVSRIGTFLQQAAVQPHRKKMWLNTTEKDPQKFRAEVETVCRTYLEAPTKAAADGAHTVSVDEATSLQALERNAPDKPVQPDSVPKREFEYTRHGTTTLTAGLDVVTGMIVGPTLEATRTEPEFVAHIARTVDTDPTGEWIFVVDCLNTHMSESLVKFVAERCGLPDALGKKRRRHPEIDGDAKGVPVGLPPPDPLRLPSEAQFVAQPDRDRIRDHPPETSARRKLRVGSGFGIAGARIRGLLQHHDGPPLRVDLHGQAGAKGTPREFRRTASPNQMG